jgi:hypothetical protein
MIQKEESMKSIHDWPRLAKTMLGGSAALLVLAIMVSSVAAQSPAYPIQPNEVLSYQFNATVDNLATEGGITDYSGNHYNGTSLGLLGLPPGNTKFAAANPAGKSANSIVFAGDDDFPGSGIWTGVTAGQLGIVNGSFTCMAFVSRNNLHIHTIGDQMVFGTTGVETVGSALHLGFRNANVYMGFWGNDSQAASQPADNFVGPAANPIGPVWHHIAWRYDATKKNQDIFVDGVLANSDPNHNPFNHNQPFLIGRTDPTLAGDNAAFSGFIEYPRVFNVALTDAQIASAAKYQY